ncbi:hypothetical protein BDW22DRAFT_1428303 [Trametopsis cervina]|nr:hypothetical protein BDW22DRAFT_1428303 [Trametopsis cervina]
MKAKGQHQDALFAVSSPPPLLGRTRNLIPWVLCLVLLLALTWPESYDRRFFNRESVGNRLTSTQTSRVGSQHWERCKGPGVDERVFCGHITVPLDYFNPDAGTAEIALARYPATKLPSKGSILFQPGGPGGAGKAMVSVLGPFFQDILSDEYDIVGFDPRGIGETTPATKCFPGPTTYADFKRNTVLARSYDLASNASVDETRRRLIAQQKEADALLRTQFEVCAETMGDSLKYMGTSTVVRDLDFITKALEGEDALINLYGPSYGSIIGQYLVNMLPDRVGRVFIDGIADATVWSSKPYYLWYRSWLSSTTDAYNIFVTRCSEVGPADCRLARRKGEDPSAIKDRIESFIDALYYEPLSVHDAAVPGILTAGRVRMYILSLLQVPETWSEGAFTLQEAISGRGARILDRFQLNPNADLARSAVSCNDNAPFEAPTAETVVDEWLDVYKDVSRAVFSVVTTEPDAGCQYWPVTPPERFQGPWNHTLRNPILIFSNTADPVTPLSSGKLVQERLGNSSRLVIQDSPGHAIISMYSKCTVGIINAFFANGTLPPPGTVCKTDHLPFGSPDDIAFMSTEELRKARAHKLIGKAMNLVRSGVPLDSMLNEIRLAR